MAYTITYSPGSGSGSSVTQTAASDGSITLKGSLFTKTGYTQIGWATSERTNGTYAYAFGEARTITKDYTLYPCWKINTYTLYYDKGDGTGTNTSVTFNHGDSVTFKGAIFSKTGHTQIGWSLSSGGVGTSAPYDLGETRTLTRGYTLYPYWQKNTYTVKFLKGTYGSGTDQTGTYEYGDSVTTPGAIFTRTGYTQTGWASDAAGTTYSRALNWTGTVNGNYTFYPYWEIKTCTITYEKGSYGTGVNVTDSYEYGETATLRGPIFNRIGYEQIAWIRDDGTEMELGASGTVYRNYTFTPKWEVRNWTVTYSAGSYGTGNTITETYGHGETANLKGSGLFTSTRTGYTQKGWSYNANGSTEDQPLNLSFEFTRNYTFYPYWDNHYTITWSGGAYGVGNDYSYTYEYGESVDVPGAMFTRTGYTQTAWIRDAGSSDERVVSFYEEGYLVLQDRTMTPQWTPNQYIIEFDGNGSTSGDMTDDAMLCTYDVSATLPTNKFRKTGYRFLGWSTSSTATSATYTNGQSISNLTSTNMDRITLYAVWSAVTYSISYDANGGTGAPATQYYTYSSTGSITLSSTIPTNGDYIFLGWSTSRYSSTIAYNAGDSFSRSVTHDTTLYAVWRGDSYTVSYDANGGTGAPDSQSKMHDVDLILSSVVPTREYYTFLGWGDSPDSTTVIYNAGDVYTANTPAMLYAIWKGDEYTVSYDANGGTGAPDSQIKVHDTPLTLSSVVPTRRRFVFLGWGESPNAVIATYNAGGSYTGNRNIILYAVWREDENIPLGGRLHTVYNGAEKMVRVHAMIGGEWKSLMLYVGDSNNTPKLLTE